MSHRSAPQLLALHGVRILGAPTIAQVAERFGLDPAMVREHLLDAQAYGWVSRWDGFGSANWSMTEAGRTENERQLAAELDATGTRGSVVAAHRAFLPLNVRHGQACTRWQLRPSAADPLSFNDHTDGRWDRDVLDSLAGIQAELDVIGATLSSALARFGGHADRHRDALDRAQRGDRAWLDAPDRASCQLVWMQFHEDLLATLGIPRGTDG